MSRTGSATRSPADGAGALAGLLVVDLSVVLAGPTATRILADLGARVIKVEGPGLDPVRTMGHPLNDDSGSWWSFVGRGKESLVLDLSRPRDREALRRLIQSADVLVESFRPGTMRRWGLHYDLLAARNPRLIMLSVTGFGSDGPRASWRGFGTLAEALTGFAVLNGSAGSPRLPPVGLADTVAGMQGAVAVLAALHERSHSGRGQQIEVDLYEPMLSLLAGHLIGVDSHRETRHARGVYRTADARWIAVSAHSAATSRAARELFGDCEFEAAQAGSYAAEDPIARWMRTRTRQVAFAELTRAGIPCVDVLSPGDVARDEQVVARRSLIEMSTAGDRVVMPGVGVRFSRSRHNLVRPAPQPNEHALALRREFGFGSVGENDERR